jgi:anaerobic ribonucleoside-triphosphate reductase activating protein
VSAAPDSVRVGISRLRHPVRTLGPGSRIGIWFQGCSIHCAGCMSRDTWAPAEPGERVPLTAVTDWVAAIPVDQVDGVTISGGEPFDQPEALGALVQSLRAMFPLVSPDAVRAVDLLVYSGYGYSQLAAEHAEIVAGVDALITEPYRQHEEGTQLRWRGSPNQRLVMVSELGRRRFAEHERAPADTGLEIDADGGTVRLIGVPRPGDLARIEQGLRRRGIALDDRSWTR